MSEEQAWAFLERAQTDKDLRDRLSSVHGVENRMEIVKGESYDCDPGEIVAAADSLSQKELTAAKGSAEAIKEVNLRSVVELFLELSEPPGLR